MKNGLLCQYKLGTGSTRNGSGFILGASHLAMRRAVEGLKERPDMALGDGNMAPHLPVSAPASIQGDATEPVIIAKAARDAALVVVLEQWPMSDFAACNALARASGCPFSIINVWGTWAISGILTIE